eukprot:1708168-Amphidinium_carterae.1
MQHQHPQTQASCILESQVASQHTERMHCRIFDAFFRRGVHGKSLSLHSLSTLGYEGSSVRLMT